MKRHSSFSLRNVLAMQFIIIAIAPLVMAALFLFFQGTPQENQKIIAAGRIPFQIENTLDEQATLLRDLSISLKNQRNAQFPDARKATRLIEKNGAFDVIYLLSKNGKITPVFQRKTYLDKDKFSKTTSGSIVRTLIPDTNTSEPSWSDAFTSPVTGVPSSAYVIPLADHLLVGEIRSTRLSEILKKQHPSLIWVVLDKNNHAVAASDSIFEKVLTSSPPLTLSRLQEKTGLFKFNNDRPEALLPIRKTSWSVFSALPLPTLAENIHQYTPLFLLCIATGIIFSLLFSFFFSRSLSSRILAYIKNTREIARGSYPLIRTDAPIREMAHLSQNLRKMSLTIQEKESGYNHAMSHYRDIIKAIENITVVLSPDLVITYVNEASDDIFGLEPEKCIGRSFLEFVKPGNIETIKERHGRWVEQGLESVTVEDKFIDNNGKPHTVLWNVTLNRDENDVFTGFTVIGHEFSAWKTMQEELQLAALVYQKSGEGMIVFNEENLIISVNPAFEAITGYTSKEVLFSNLSMLGSALHDRLFYENIWNAMDAADHWQGDVWNMRKNGELYTIRLTINTIRTPDNKIYRRVALFSDITEQKLAEKITWQQNYFDSLTGLPNRNFLKQELSRAKKINMPVALMFLGLDGFKHINETLGHMTGDMLLQETAQRLQHCIRETDAAIRLGGDEFAILLRNITNPEEVETIGKTILSGLSEAFFLNNAVIHISASIGITFYPDDATDTDDLLKNADQAMHAAKREGKNTLLYFTRSMQEMAQVRMQLINDLRQALAGHQFEIMYQPIVEIESGLIRKAEALIRWQHPVRGTINPVEFISIAEDTGMITSFGNWIFHEAATQARIWRERFHPDFQISINISPVQFKNEGIDFINWMSHLQELQLPGNGLVVEITEGLLMEKSDHISQQLATFKNAGMEIALDDFGVGYSSLSYLQNFNFDYLKIDQSFIRNLSQSSDNQALCEAIIVMAHKLHLKVIAEGIETIRQREILVEATCDFGQGYLYSTPLPPAEFELILENNYALFNSGFLADIA
ncbi:EAL domain-containing protein [Oxalobacter vibrioformis]|uniref:EAL domain-containing protein n=1 Tax=Oxalobacter vibrioformis TaxID=933080 RepID=A0A9E9P528_9BURK|nr:EAL domain-containing protein [Oxalobacter vibrioformis]WAW10696.1 EAL domain-containing protein [Oxalobacter vibrioformis]